ncbi:MAG TPA: hypothetical protein VN900_16910 [Stellaceae bacterium]|jgi:hypothetical protein|nr:hypothetical protein [Stellaceae bacterium]
MHKRSHPTRNACRIALLLGLTAGLLAGPARAADTGNGSKNFRVPNSVPNYFSNEAGPMMGPAAETRRGELYSNQTAQVPQAAPAVVAAAPVRARQHIAMAEPRGRAIRGGRAERVVAHHVAVHGRSVTRVVAHGSSRAHSTHVAARTRAVSKTTRVSSTHRRARG